jgi:hypothetical protein
MPVETEEQKQELLDLQVEAQEALNKVLDAAIKAVPVLTKLKREQFRRTDPKLRSFVLGTHDQEGQVNVAVATMLQNAVRGIVL